MFNRLETLWIYFYIGFKLVRSLKKIKSFGVIISLIWIKNWEKQLKNKAIKTNSNVDIAAYKNQRNYVIALNKITLNTITLIIWT